MSPAPLPGLYVHVPFCKTKCPYCDFYSVTDDGALERWLGAVEAEARLFAGRFETFETVYVGGGTPSVLPGDALARLLGSLRSTFSLTADAELTVEVNPDDGTKALLGSLVDLGVHRVSLGVQSLDDRALTFLGRRHDALGARDAISKVRDLQGLALSVDVIHGWPGQRPEDLIGDLDALWDYEPEHLSCYALTVEGETPFSKRLRRGDLELPDEELARELFLAASNHLSRSGYEHYEVSSFAQPGCRSRHNEKYWRHVPYLGLGPGAHSFLGTKRWWNDRNLASYVSRLEAGASPEGGFEELTDEQIRLEELFLGLRTSDGVSVELLQGRGDWTGVVSRLEEEGILRRRGDRVAPTAAGLAVADGLPLLFG